METSKRLDKDTMISVSDYVLQQIAEKLADFALDPLEIIKLLNTIKFGTITYYSKPHAKNPEMKSVLKKMKKLDELLTQDLWKESEKRIYQKKV
jgi:hypothetical protein